MKARPVETDTSWCPRCGQMLPVDAFYRDLGRANGRQSYCKECWRTHVKAHNLEHREERNAAQRKRYWAKKNGTYEPKHVAGRSQLEVRYDRVKTAAERRGYAFTLTVEEFGAYWGKPCAYCAGPTDTVRLDRIDNARGYEPGNVVPCCGQCNMMKGELTQEQFYAQVAAIMAVWEGRAA